MKIESPLTFLPIRAEAMHRSEQVSQLLFGETAEVLDSFKEWYLIRCDFDGYSGWVDMNSTIPAQRDQQKKTIKAPSILKTPESEILLSTGSEFCESDEPNIYRTGNKALIKDDIIELAELFLGTPYLWGGRSIYGVDCSGFVQVVHKALGISLPRDASQQIDFGANIEFANQALPGDLAFFHNNEGIITHVGIIADEHRIIHASVSVRYDLFDQYGIFHKEKQKYTHELRAIKRIKKAAV